MADSVRPEGPRDPDQKAEQPPGSQVRLRSQLYRRQDHRPCQGPFQRRRRRATPAPALHGGRRAELPCLPQIPPPLSQRRPDCLLGRPGLRQTSPVGPPSKWLELPTSTRESLTRARAASSPAARAALRVTTGATVSEPLENWNESTRVSPRQFELGGDPTGRLDQRLKTSPLRDCLTLVSKEPGECLLQPGWPRLDRPPSDHNVVPVYAQSGLMAEALEDDISVLIHLGWLHEASRCLRVGEGQEVAAVAVDDEDRGGGGTGQRAMPGPRDDAGGRDEGSSSHRDTGVCRAKSLPSGVGPKGTRGAAERLAWAAGGAGRPTFSVRIGTSLVAKRRMQDR